MWGGFSEKYTSMNNNKFAYIGKPLAKIIDKLATLSDYNSSTKSGKAKRLLLEAQTWHFIHYKKLVLAENVVDNDVNLFKALKKVVSSNLQAYSLDENMNGGVYFINALAEIGRYLEDPNNKFYTMAKTYLVNLNTTYNANDNLRIYGKTSSIIDSYSDIDIGDWKDNVNRSFYYSSRQFTIFNDEITVRLFGNITADQLEMVEEELLKTWGIFKEIFGEEDDLTPATGDNTTQLDVWVHDSRTNYKNYASILFGVDVDNGGIFIERDPSVTNNIADLFIYGFDFDGPWKSWNAGHEFWHFLDAKFILAGPYDPAVSVGWIEGNAEFVQKGLIYGSINDRKHEFQTAVDSFKSNPETTSNIIDIPEQSLIDWVAQDIYTNPSVLWAFFFDEDKLKLRSIGETLKGLSAEQLKTQSVSILKEKVAPYNKHLTSWAKGSFYWTGFEGSYNLISNMSDYKYFDVFGGSNSDETPIISHSYNGGNNQKFYLEPIDNYKTHTYDIRQFGVYLDNEFYIKSVSSNKYLKINATDNTKSLKQGPVTNDIERVFSIVHKNNGYFMLTVNPDGTNRYALSKSTSNTRAGHYLVDAIAPDFSSWRQAFWFFAFPITGERSISSSNRGVSSTQNLSNKSPEADSKLSYSIFPNPTSSNFVNFTYPRGIGNLKIEAYTITGQRTSLSKIIDDNSGRGNLELNLATGVYLVKFINLDDNKTVTKKLVVL